MSCISTSRNSEGAGRRSIRFLLAIVGCFIPIVIVVIVQVRWESTFLSKSISTASTNINMDGTVPNLIECIDKCLHFMSPHGCYISDGVPLRGENRWAGNWKNVTDNNTLSTLSLLNESNDYSTKNKPFMGWKRQYLRDFTLLHNDGYISNVNQTTTILTGDIVVVLLIHTPQRNINHIFHDDFWSILSYFSQPSTLQNLKHSGNSVAPVTVTLVHDYSSPWLTSLVEIIVQAYPWWNVAPPLPSYDNRWICTSLSQSQKLYVNGYVRNMHHYQLPELIRIRYDLRSVAYLKLPIDDIWTKILEDSNETTTESLLETNGTTTKKEWIVIYTREDTPTRNIHDPQKIIDTLDTDRYNVHIQRYMPSNFNEQVAMFGMADLLIAPNGGWTPNVLWMKDTACLVEIHLYETGSWLVTYGLASLFQPNSCLLVTGDYHNTTLGPRLILPNRGGNGDDEIQGSMVIADIVQQLKQSPDCQRFLKE